MLVLSSIEYFFSLRMLKRYALDRWKFHILRVSIEWIKKKDSSLLFAGSLWIVSYIEMLHVTLNNSKKKKNTCQKYIAYLSILITIPSREKNVNINSNSISKKSYIKQL